MPERKKILFICGTRNTTTQMHQISEQLSEHDAWFSNFYADGFLDLSRRLGLLEASILGNRMRNGCFDYFAAHGLRCDPRGARGDYDLVVTTHDAVLPRNIRRRRIVMVQEGITDPPELAFHLVKRIPFLPRWIAVTQATGLSNGFDRFCVASEGYRRFFLRNGVRADKLTVTGIPNFDDCAAYAENDFPYRGYVLVCTSDLRECLKKDDRPAFLRRCVEIAEGRPLIFKLHPNGHADRARREIEAWAPGSLVVTGGAAEPMIANCEVLVTQWSSTAYVGIALGKQVHSYADVATLRELCPLQNKSAASNIAEVCREVLALPPPARRPPWPFVRKAPRKPNRQRPRRAPEGVLRLPDVARSPGVVRSVARG